MEKLQIILGHARKHHFWLLCILAIVLASLGWLQASGKLSTAYKDQVQKVNSEFEKVSRVSSEEHPPNERWKSEVDKMRLDLRDRVYELWKQEYSQQRDKILKWPKELGPKFLNFTQNMGPTDDIPYELCQKYWYYIRAEFPKLREIIKAQNPDDEREQGATGGGGFSSGRFQVGPQAGPGNRRDKQTDPAIPTRKEKNYVVEWDAGDQRRIQEELDIKVQPNSKEVRNLQEDLWVYRALLQVIANVNDTSTGQFNAKVKRLKHVAIGAAATEQFKAGNASSQVYVPPKPMGSPEGIPTGGDMTAAGGATVDGAEQSPDAGRYVDAQGKPMTTPAEQAELKRMPVYLKLVMDQRQIQRLLAECANSPLPIEVRQLPIKSLQTVPGGGTLFDLATAARAASRPSGGNPFSAAGGGGFSPGGRFQLGGGGGAGGFNAGGNAAVGLPGSDKDENPHDVDVELHGIICIFNPPDKNKLDMVAASAEAAPPAESPPAEQPPVGAGPPAAAPMNPAVPAAPATGPAAPAQPPVAAPEPAAPQPPAAPGNATGG